MSDYMPEIYITSRDGVHMTTSLDVAEKFGKRHDNVIAAIKKIEGDNYDFGALNFKGSSYIGDQNKKHPMFYITRSGFSVLAMGFTGKKALEWKIKYEQTFSIMEAALINRKNLSWQQERENGKLARRSETDVIKKFVEYATAQGSSKASFYYKHLTTATYKALFIVQDKFPGSFRDMLDAMQLSFLQTAEYVAQRAISEGMNEGMYYKDIFQLAKKRIESCGAVVGVTPVINYAPQMLLTQVAA